MCHRGPASVASALLILCLSAFTLMPAPRADAAAFDRSFEQQLNRAVNGTMRGIEAPGAIVGVTMGRKSWTAVKGSATRNRVDRPNFRMHTRIGSVTKTFTGTLVLQLAREGRLRLGDTIDRWFPDFPAADRITIRNLGDMSSGINSYTASKPIVDRYLTYPRTVWKPARLIEASAKLPTTFPAGEGFFYSNTNFLMLGKIVEEVTGKPIAKVLRERIFKPVGMNRTSYPGGTAIPRPHWQGYTDQAVEGSRVRNATEWSPTFLGAAGQIVSTLPDMVRYTQALGSGRLVGPAMQRQRLKPNPASVAGTRRYLFALGDDNGWLSHSGEVPGFNTQIAYLPKKRATVVVLTNADIPNPDGSGNPAPAIFRSLAEVIAPRHVPTG